MINVKKIQLAFIFPRLSILFCLSMAYSQALIQPSDITYMGAFRVDEAWQPNYKTMEYSNAAIAFYPNGDPANTDTYSGSLFISGHVYQEYVKEISIPTPVISQTLSQLPIATDLRPLADVDPANDEVNTFIMGMVYIPSQNKVFYTRSGDYVDGDCDLPGHGGALGSFDPNTMAHSGGMAYLNTGTRQHPYQTLRYITNIPPAWSQPLSNMFLATGRHRGWCLEGSHLYGSAPVTLPSESDVSAIRLMEFGPFDGGINYPWPASAHYPKEHSYANAYQGAAWLTAGSKAAFALTGTIDYDPANSYYGYANWVLPNQCEPSGTCPPGGRGWRQSQPHPTILLYDPQDFVDVANGSKQSWEPQWYARIDLSPYMLRNYEPTYLATGADAENILASYDSANGHLYISESFANSVYPVIHVFKVNSTGEPPPTGFLNAPTNLQITN